MDRSVIIDSQMYILSTDARKQALESLQTPEGLEGMIIVPWIQQHHFTLVVGYATGDHMHCFHIDSLAVPCSIILESFIATTRKETPISITPVATNTGTSVRERDALANSRLANKAFRLQACKRVGWIALSGFLLLRNSQCSGNQYVRRVLLVLILQVPHPSPLTFKFLFGLSLYFLLVIQGFSSEVILKRSRPGS
jgi:hypothetical protein